MNRIPRILVLCTGNSCRSQMAEGFLRQAFGEWTVVRSAGVVAHGLNPRAVAVMAEAGVDISEHRSKTIEELEGEYFDHVITVCDHARENCPWLPTAAQRWHQDFLDPAIAVGTEEEILAEFRWVRDLIREYCVRFARDVDRV